MKTLLTILFACTGIMLFAQGLERPLKPLDLITSYEQEGSAFKTVNPFENAETLNKEVSELDAREVDFDVLKVNPAFYGYFLEDSPETFTLRIPAPNQGGTLEVKLAKVDVHTSDFKLSLGSGATPPEMPAAAHYRGIVEGYPGTIAAISIFENEFMGLIATDAGNLVLGKLKGERWSGEHIIYNDKNVKHKDPFECGTMDDGIGYKKKDLTYDENRAPGDCIRLYIEVDKDIHDNKGGVSGATNYASGLLNEVITLYANENIAAVVSQIVVWDVTSPYSSTSSSGMLSDFQAYHTQSSWSGDLGHLLSYQASGGIAAGFSGICNSNRDNSLCFSSIQSSYAVVPTYSWSVMVTTHEFGHLWGSRHTHACVWNGNNTAIDGCAGSTEGTCQLPGYPSEGGTIMSYCHLQSVGINFNNGFGPQPGNVIRNSVDNATCTSACGPPTCDDGIQNGDETGVDCGGPDCAACPSCDDGIQNGEELGVDCGGPDCAPCPCNGQDVTITIVTDNYPGETTWTITSGGLTYASGGPYGSAGTTETTVVCLNDGCYEFNIFDSYGDGICCSFGSGSYEVTDASGTVLASGGSFGSSESTPFCLSSTPSLTASISGTTDVSCAGGSDGSATATATDGVSPYSYSWSNGATGATASGLSAGSYTVTVTDSDGNTDSATATVGEPSALSVTASGTDASCQGATDGSASASSSGGTGSVTYNWSNGATGSSISGLAEGTYSVTATDGNGCTATDAVTIGAPAPGGSCDDGDACTTNDVLDANCNCAGTFQDSDGDGVCDANDACPGFDDSVDTDGDSIPDGCDSNNCTTVTNNFPVNPLTHSGSGSSSTTLTYSNANEEVSFTISNINQQISGNPNNRYIEVVTVTYADGSGQSQNYGTFSGASVSSVDVVLPGSVLSVTVSLEDGYDGNSAQTMSVNLSNVSSCDPGGACPDDDGDGVCNASDVCPGFDDNIDSDGDGVPDGCDTGGGCTTSTDNFSVNPLTHSGAGSSSSVVSYSNAHYDVAFTISNIGAQQNGNPNGRYIEVVTVEYVDGSGQNQVYGSFSGASVSSVDVSIPGDVQSITVSLEDGYDGNSSTTMSVDLSEVTSCDGAAAAPAGGTGLEPQQDEKAAIAELFLFPNPAENRLSFNVELPEAAFVQTVITDFKGKAVYQQGRTLEAGAFQSEVNVSELPAGVYAFHLMWEDQRLVKKFVIVR